MNRTWLLLLSLLSIVVLAVAPGCGGSRRRSAPATGTDAGTSRDAGDDPVPPDSGPVVMIDLGRDLGTAPSCTPSVVDYVTGAYCSAATQSCIGTCADSTCFQNCLAADPSPDCSTCVTINQLACANANGCLSQWNTYDCCAQRDCPTGSPSTCLDTHCVSEWSSFLGCANSVLPSATCSVDYTGCF